VVIIVGLLVGFFLAKSMKYDDTEERKRAVAVSKRSTVLKEDTQVLVNDDDFFAGFGLTEKTRGRRHE